MSCQAGHNRPVLLEEVAQTSAVVTGTSSRLGKVEALASCLSRARGNEVPVAVAYLSGELPHAPIGVGWAALRELPPAAAAPALELLEVDAALRRIGETAGRGSQAARRELLAALLGRATEAEQRFLVRLLLGELRQGALEGVMVDAVARAAGVPVARGAARADAERRPRRRRRGGARRRGGGARRVPARAAPAARADARADGATTWPPRSPASGRAALEWKLDGARIQVHRLGDEVRVFTRNLADVTARVPELVEAVLALPVEAIVLDGEAIALADGRPPAPVPGHDEPLRQQGSERRDPALGLLLRPPPPRRRRPARPARARAARRARRGRPRRRCACRALETDDPDEAERFLGDALAPGHEGVMVKALDAPYEAGRRGGGWLKVKRAHTLDLVVLAAEWGHGRRQGWLSNLHLGARDPATGGFVMLGKTFKGMTDAMLAWQTERLLELETHRDSWAVHVRPELVVEIAFDGVQESSRYPGGVALRFARVKGYRTGQARGRGRHDRRSARR